MDTINFVKKLLLLFLFPTLVFGQGGPIIRNPFTTNSNPTLTNNADVARGFGGLVDGHVLTWDFVSGTWTNKIPTGGGDAGGTNARQFGTLALTNLSANPIPYTNIIVAADGVALGTNAGVVYITNIIAFITNLFQPASINLTNWSNIPTGEMANVVSVTFLTNWINAVSNYVTAATNSSLVTNWIVLRQPADPELTNWAEFSTNVIADTATNLTKFLTNIWGDVAKGFGSLSDGQVLKYDAISGRWTNATDQTGGAGATNAIGQVRYNGGTVGIDLTIADFRDDGGSKFGVSSNSSIVTILVTNEVNGEISLTNNANLIFGLVKDFIGGTNRLKAIALGYGLFGTNHPTNVMIAIDPIIVALQTDLNNASNTLDGKITTASNAVLANQVWTNNTGLPGGLETYRLVGPTNFLIGPHGEIMIGNFVTNWFITEAAGSLGIIATQNQAIVMFADGNRGDDLSEAVMTMVASNNHNRSEFYFYNAGSGNDLDLYVKSNGVITAGFEFSSFDTGLSSGTRFKTYSEGTDAFFVDFNGNLNTIEGVPSYNWPNAHAVGALTNNGSGVLGYYVFASPEDVVTASNAAAYLIWTNNQGRLALIDPGSNVVSLIQTNYLEPRIFIFNGGPGPALMSNTTSTIGIGDSVLSGANMTNTLTVIGIGYRALQEANITNASLVFAYGFDSFYRTKLKNVTDVQGFGESSFKNGNLSNVFDTITYGANNFELGSLRNIDNITSIGSSLGYFSEFYQVTNMVLAGYNILSDFAAAEGIQDVIAFGNGTLHAALLTNSIGMIFIGKNAGNALVGSGYNNVVAIGDNTTVAAANDFTLGNSSHNIKVDGTFALNQLTADTILYADINKRITSVPNGTGMLTNNGSGTVGYMPIPTGGSGSGTNTWTNTTLVLRPAAYPDFVNIRNSDGSLFNGDGIDDIMFFTGFNGITNTNRFFPLWSIISTNSSTNWDFRIGNVADSNGNYSLLEAKGTHTGGLNKQTLDLHTASTSADTHAMLSSDVGTAAGANSMASLVLDIASGNDIVIRASNNASVMRIGNTAFVVTNDGNISRIRGAALSWPSANALGALTNDGSGTLGWNSSIGGGGGLSTILKSNAVYVMKNGNDGTGVRGKLELPFLTIDAALLVARTNDTIIVFPGIYTNQLTVGLSNGVNYEFIGQGDLYLHDTNGGPVFSDGGVLTTNYINAIGWRLFGRTNQMLLNQSVASKVEFKFGELYSDTNMIAQLTNNSYTKLVTRRMITTNYDVMFQQNFGSALDIQVDYGENKLGHMFSPDNSYFYCKAGTLICSDPTEDDTKGVLFALGSGTNSYYLKADRIHSSGGWTVWVTGGISNCFVNVDHISSGGDCTIVSGCTNMFVNAQKISNTNSGPYSILNCENGFMTVANASIVYEGDGIQTDLKTTVDGILKFMSVEYTRVALSEADAGTIRRVDTNFPSGIWVTGGGNITINTLSADTVSIGTKLIISTTTGQTTSPFDINATNGTVGLSTSSNGFQRITTPLFLVNAVDNRTNQIDLNINHVQQFTNSLRTNLVLQLTNSSDGAWTRVDAFGSGKLEGVNTNAWNILCTASAGTTIYWPVGTTNGNFDVLVNSNQLCSLFYRTIFRTNISAYYTISE